MRTHLLVAVLVIATVTSSAFAERVLVFSRTKGFRHQSIPAGIKALQDLGAKHDFEVVATEDPRQFNDESLARFSVIVFLNTTGDVLDDEQQAAMERFIRGGKGFVGIHSATDTEYDWPWYQRLVGAAFKGHPHVQEATIIVEDRTHPSTSHLPERWTRVDEWYDFRASPRNQVKVLARLDESTYEGGGMGEDHPIAWYHEMDGGRSWYTAGGHTSEAFGEADFRKHILGGVTWAMRRGARPTETTESNPAPDTDAADPSPCTHPACCTH